MQKTIARVIVVASAVALAVGSAACSNHDGSEGSSSIAGPSSLAAKRPGGGGGGGKGGGGTTSGGGSLSLVMYIDVNGDGLPNVGDTVTFNVSTTATDTPTVNLTCYQNGVAVYGSQGAFYASDPWQWTRYMKLYSASWGSGAASCTATLSPQGGSPILATLNFTAGA